MRLDVPWTSRQRASRSSRNKELQFMVIDGNKKVQKVRMSQKNHTSQLTQAQSPLLPTAIDVQIAFLSASHCNNRFFSTISMGFCGSIRDYSPSAHQTNLTSFRSPAPRKPVLSCFPSLTSIPRAVRGHFVNCLIMTRRDHNALFSDSRCHLVEHSRREISWS